MNRPPSEVVVLHEISKTYSLPDRPLVRALDRVTFSVHEGEIFGVIGPNGAGKSTLLKVLSRITEPTSGKARLRGRSVSLLEVGTCFHPELSGRENVFMYGALLGMSRREIRNKYQRIVEFADIGDFMSTPIKFYSSGMAVRLAFAVAAQVEADLWLIDEALAVGDYVFQAKCLNHLRTISHQGSTAIVVSHNLGWVKKLCPRSALLEHGQVRFIGDTGEAISLYLSEKVPQRGDLLRERNRQEPLCVRRVALIPDGEKNSRYQIGYHEGFSIRIEYDIHETLAGASVGIGLGSLDGTALFASSDIDSVGPREIWYPGSACAEVRIPGKWLNVGSFLVQVYACAGPRPADWKTFDALVFHVIDTGSPAARSGILERKGALQPELVWEVKPHRRDEPPVFQN